VLRDPLDRFLSAYLSKCILAESGPWDCFWLRSSPSLTAVVRKLENGDDKGNSHWAPQARMCGGLNHNLGQYQHIINFSAISTALPPLLAAHDLEYASSAPAFYAQLAQPKTGNPHITSMTSLGRAYRIPEAELRIAKTFVRRHYAEDYELLMKAYSMQRN
jgi:hypothetical protein